MANTSRDLRTPACDGVAKGARSDEVEEKTEAAPSISAFRRVLRPRLERSERVAVCKANDDTRTDHAYASLAAGVISQATQREEQGEISQSLRNPSHAESLGPGLLRMI